MAIEDIEWLKRQARRQSAGTPLVARPAIPTALKEVSQAFQALAQAAKALRDL